MTRNYEIGSAIVMALLVVGCVGGDSEDSPEGHGGGATPAELQGAWYAGRGGTTAPYDPSTGSWGMPSGSGLVYVFEPGGTYTKAFQSYESSGGCTTGFTAFESGVLVADDQVLTTRPSSGRLVYRATCAPDLDSDEPLTDLYDETFDWALVPGEYDPASTVLYLRRTDGAEATFARL